jgi:hypothetical protein
MAATLTAPLSTPHRDPTPRTAIRRADAGTRDNAPLTVSLAECLLARYGDERPKDATARLMLMVARSVAR